MTTDEQGQNPLSDYWVKVKRPCAECQGRGWERHPAWAQFWDWHIKAKKTVEEFEAMDVAALDDWFREHAGAPETPEEEVPCGVCGGDKHVQEWISLAELAGLLLQAAVEGRDEVKTALSFPAGPYPGIRP